MRRDGNLGNTPTGRAPFSMRSWRIFHEDHDSTDAHEDRLADFWRRIGAHAPLDPDDWRADPGKTNALGHNTVVGRLTRGQLDSKVAPRQRPQYWYCGTANWVTFRCGHVWRIYSKTGKPNRRESRGPCLWCRV